MNANLNAVLEQLAAASLKKCLLRLSRVSAGTWEVLEIKASAGTLEYAVKQHDFKNPAAAVYFSLNAGSPLTAIMLFNPQDMECISKGFTGHSFPRGARTTPAEEIMLLELGNIVLNAMVNSVLNVIKKSAMPAVPEFMEGDAPGLVSGLGASVDLKREFCVIKATLAIRCDTSVTNTEVFALVPGELLSGIAPV